MKYFKIKTYYFNFFKKKTSKLEQNSQPCIIHKKLNIWDREIILKLLVIIYRT
jgi:hypothetical protein